MDQLSYYITIHEMAKVDASHALTISAHTNLGTSPIVEFGTEEQKRRYVPLLASGQGAGRIRARPSRAREAMPAAPPRPRWTRAITTCSTAPRSSSPTPAWARSSSVTARTEPGKGNKGITSFIVTKDTVDLEQCRELGVGHAEDLPKTRGVRAGKKEDKMGWRASDTRELIFEDAIVPKENLLGRPGQGFINFLKTLDAGRIGIAALSLGIAEGAYEEALRYAGVRKQFGRPIGSFQGVSFQLADMAMEIEAGTHLLYHAAWLKQNGRPFKKEAAMAKLFCSELAMRTTTKAVQIFGGYGYTTEYPVERMMRDAKVCEIGEGTSEIQRIVIARQILGERGGLRAPLAEPPHIARIDFPAQQRVFARHRSTLRLYHRPPAATRSLGGMRLILAMGSPGAECGSRPRRGQNA